MIQDIGNHQFDRSYSRQKATAQDIALCYRAGKVLLRREEASYALPRFGDFPAQWRPDGEAACHVFALDGVGCFIAHTEMSEEDLPDTSWEYVSMRSLRAVRPMEVAFAAVTGEQLRRWYECRAYCGRCGAKTEHSRTERAIVCPACGLTEYPKICPAVIVAVRDGERLLATRYANRPYNGWALIAGFVEIGETLEDTVHREVMEEVGLRVKNLRYYKNQPWAFTDAMLVGFYCELDGEADVTLDRNELCEGVWLRRDEIVPRENDISLTAEMMERFRLGME